jgi:hypothetical protein
MRDNGESAPDRQIHLYHPNKIEAARLAFRMLNNGDQNRAFYVVPTEQEPAEDTTVKLWIEPLVMTVDHPTPELAVIDEYAPEQRHE